jgi:hypothetical protein
VTSLGATRNAHPDFGSGLVDGAPFGIPVTSAAAGQAKVAVSFDYADESDPGPYPIPPNALIEGGPNADGDRHVLVHDPAACKVYEMFDARRNSSGSWHAAAGAVFDPRSNKLRPITGTQDERWKNSELNALKGLTGNNFEAVDAGSGATRR